MAQASINIRTDPVLKRDFEHLCQDVGLNVSTAFTMFMKQSVREHALSLSMKGDPYRITEEELLRRISLMNEGYCVEKTIEELDLIDNE